MDWKGLIASHAALTIIPTELRETGVFRNTRAGESLFRLGDRTRGMFYVVAGEIRLIRRAANGAAIILQRSRSGFVAEASLGEKAYHCDALVAEAGGVLKFPLAAFRAALDGDSVFRHAWQAHLAREVRQLRAQCERLSLKSAGQRIIHYIASEGAPEGLTLVQSRKVWASELGLTHEALYRTLRQLREEGLVRIEGNCIALSGPKNRSSRTGR